MNASLLPLVPAPHPGLAALAPPPATDAARPGADAELLEGLLRDDPAAWRTFNQRYSRLIHRCITRVTARFSSVVGAEDVREVYAQLCVQLLAHDKKKLRTFQAERGHKLGSWLGMLAIHTAYDHLRSVRREPRRAPLLEAERLRSELPDPYESFVMRERARRVTDVLRDFSEKDREFITLYFGEGLAPELVAERMGISVKTVYSKKHKIRARLESLMAARLAA